MTRPTPQRLHAGRISEGWWTGDGRPFIVEVNHSEGSRIFAAATSKRACSFTLPPVLLLPS